LNSFGWPANGRRQIEQRYAQEVPGDDFRIQPVKEPAREGVVLDLLFANRAGLVGDVMAGGRLGHSDLERIEFSIDGEVRRGVSRTTTLEFQRADFVLFRGLVDRVP